MQSQPLALFLMGPTASGKTELAIKLRQKFPVEIISVDSALIYRGMDIGTAKPEPWELELAPHRLIDILDPADSYSAADFRRDALDEMEKITKQGKIPLLVGGTMLYYKALIDGLSPLPSADPSIRAEIERQAEQHSWQWLHQQLAEFDPVSAERIHPNDPQRLSRAIEVYRITGKSLTELTQQKSEPIPYNVKQFAIAPKERSQLHQRIELRYQKMIEAGFKQEVEKLYDRGDLHKDLPSIRCVGYRQMWEHLEGDISLDEAIFKSVCATRQLAKRQMTWLRSWKDLVWLDSDHKDQALETLSNAVISNS